MVRKRKSFIEKYYKFALKKNSKLNSVRMSVPFTIKCVFCSTFTFKGSKQNALKKKLKTEKGADIYVLFIRCKKCNNEMSIQTDPFNGKYAGYSGCRVFEEEKKEEKEQSENIHHVCVKKGKERRLEDIEVELIEQLKK